MYKYRIPDSYSTIYGYKGCLCGTGATHELYKRGLLNTTIRSLRKSDSSLAEVNDPLTTLATTSDPLTTLARHYFMRLGCA